MRELLSALETRSKSIAGTSAFAVDHAARGGADVIVDVIAEWTASVRPDAHPDAQQCGLAPCLPFCCSHDALHGCRPLQAVLFTKPDAGSRALHSYHSYQ